MLWEMGSMTESCKSNGYFPVSLMLFREVGTRAAQVQQSSQASWELHFKSNPRINAHNNPLSLLKTNHKRRESFMCQMTSHLHHLHLLVRSLDGLQPRESAPGEDLSHWLRPISRGAIEHAALDISHALGGRPIPPDCRAAVATEVACHGVTRVGGRGVLHGRSGDAELRCEHDPVESEGRAGDPMAVAAVAECLVHAISTYHDSRTGPPWTFEQRALQRLQLVIIP